MDTINDRILDQHCALRIPRVKPLGGLVLFGPQAFPVLHGDDAGDIPAAAAGVGDGRICVTTNPVMVNGELPQMQHFYRASREWVSGGAYQSEADVFYITSTAKEIPEGKKIVVFNGGKVKPAMENECMKFVEEGGGIIWGGKGATGVISKGLPYQNIPLINLIIRAGIFFTGVTIKKNKDGFEVKRPDFSHNIRAHLSATSEDFGNLKQHGPPLRKKLKYIPTPIMAEHLTEPLIRLVTLYEAELMENLPSAERTVIKNKHVIQLLNIINIMADNKIYFTKAPSVAHFPFDFPSPPDDLVCGEVNITGRYMEAYPTGYYLPAGEELLVEVMSEDEDFTDWTVQIGAHTDSLHRLDKIERLPIVFVQRRLHSRKMRIHSPYGGLVYVQSPDDESDIHIRFANVVQAPFFNKRNPDAVNFWLETRNSAGLWADIAGDNIVFTVPAADVRHIPDFTEILEYWDAVVAGQNDLRGTDHTKDRRQWFVADKQPAVGAMHAGYPIVTHLNISDPLTDTNVFNMDVIKKEGKWGAFHEIGHNMQRFTWTYKGSREVTNNIFSLYSMDTFTEEKLWIHPWPAKKMTKAVKYLKKKGAEFDPMFAILLYTQLAHHFGWESYKKFFRTYEDPDIDQPDTQKEKLDEWIIRFSNVVEYNLSPMFEFWRFEITRAVRSQLKHLQVAFPDDEMFRLAPQRYREILDKYGGEDKVLTSVREFEVVPNVSCSLSACGSDGEDECGVNDNIEEEEEEEEEEREEEEEEE